MSVMSDSLCIVLLASLSGIACSTLGVFLVLRRMSMLGDAISHSVLFGIVVAFLLSSSRAPIGMLLGAALVGVVTVFTANLLNRNGHLSEDASIGVTYTALFALGVVLISVFAGQVDLDPDCVLYGEIAFAPLYTVTIGGFELARSLVVLIVACAANVLFVYFGFRRLKLLCFDPLLAASSGIAVAGWHYTLMALVSFTTVASFESVGAILVVALLVIPANTAWLCASSLGQMLVYSWLFAVAAALSGFWLARQVDGSIAAAMVLVSGALFFMVFIARLALRRWRTSRPLAA